MAAQFKPTRVFRAHSGKCKVSIMSDIPTNKPLGILKTSNRNDNFKVPSLGVSKPEKEQNKSWHYNTTPRPTKAVNNENINPNGNFPESTKETPGKTIFELCKQMSALALLMPDGMQQSTRDTQAQPKKVKLPFSEPFAGVDKLVEKDYLSDPEEIEPDNVPRKTLVITDDDEFFTDASEYFKNEDLNIDNTSDNDAFKSLESSPRTSLNVAGTLMKNNNSGERDSESAIIGIDETQEASLPEKISDKNIHEKLEYIEPEINSDLFNEAIHNQNIGNLSESHENKNPSSQVICIEPETVAEHHAEDFTNLPKDAKLTNSTDVENGDYLKIIDQNSDSIPIDEKSVNVIKSVETANDSSNASTNESYILQPPLDEKQNTDILDVCKVEEKIAEISIPEKFDHFNAEDKSKDRTPDSSSVNTSEISNQINESVATGSTKTDKNMSDSETTLMTVQTEEKISGAKETVDSLESEIANCLTLKEKIPEEKSSDNVEHFECSPKIDAANVDAEKTEENNSNLLESQNVECSHESPKPQSTEENTRENAQLSKAIDNASVAENVEINKPVADIGRPVDEQPVLHSSVNVIQSVETANDSSDTSTNESYILQPPVDEKQNTDILDVCHVKEKIAEISVPEKFDNFNAEDKSKDRTPDSSSVDTSEISNQINESVAAGSTKTDKNMSGSETTLMTVQTEEKISGAKETVDSLETEIANCLTSKEKSSDNVEHFECSSKIGTANVDAEKNEEDNSNLLESQNTDCSHGNPKPQSTEENTSVNAHLSKAIDNASVAENVEIKKPVADIGRPVDEKPFLHLSVNVIQSVETPNDSSYPLTMESNSIQLPVDEKQNTDILDTCKVEEKIAEISVPETFDNFNDQDKSKDRTPDSDFVAPPEISNQINESVATGSTKTDKNMLDSETTLMTVQTEEKISGAKETVDSLETGIANCLTSKEKSSDNVEHFECSSKIGTANVDAENNSNLLESQNVDCSHESPKPQSTEENTSRNAQLSKAIDNASVAENVEIKKPVSDIGRPVDDKPVPQSSVNVIQSVEMPNDSSDPLTMAQPPVDEKQNTDILDTCKVEERIAEISIPENFDYFNDEDKSKDRTPDSSSVGSSEISNQIHESVATGSTKTDKHMSASETTLMTVQTEEKISGAKKFVDSFETGIANCLTTKEKIPEEKSSDNVEHFECSSKIGTANVDAEKTEEKNSNLLESQNVDCSHGYPKPQLAEENTHENAPLSKAIDNASVAENVEIKKPVVDIGRPNDIEEEVMESSEVKDASDHSKINCEIPNSIAASDDNLQKFEIISNPSVFKDVDTFSTNTHLLNSPKSIQGSQSNIDISFEGRTQMANSPVAAVAVENDIQIDITPTSPNKQQQVGNGKHAGSQSRQNINEKPNRKELNEITDLVTAVNDTHICEDDISTILKGAEPSDSAETANYDEQEPNIQFEEKTNGFICDDDDWELLNCDKTVINASRLCRESLYVKFDPLLGLNNTIDFDMNKRKSVSKQPALEKIKSPPKSPDLIMMDSPTRKSMYQKVNPLRKTNNSTNNNLDDIFSLSPANNNADAIFFGTPLPQKKNSEIVQVLKYTEEDWLKMKQNIELEYQNRLMSASKELTHKMSELTEEHQKALNEKDVEMEQRKKDLLQLQTEKKAGQEKLNEMKKVLDEYTVLMDHLAAEKQKRADDYTKGIDGSKKEVDLIQDELQTVQKAYSDLHRRFEKAKTIIESLKKNEEMLKDHVKDMVSKVKEGKVALVTLKKESQETQSNLEKEVAALKKKLTIDTSCLEASGKRKDMKIAELQNELELKKNQIKELTKICDDLMEKVG
ncbi:putative leucine-rich repeat-containing protein DDB_G0290503 [Octopus sinensis]|uniref:Leucine-rich repeat-containing protein DDB_G0290503 n=1 Tax=Octopus sinensis TaxID=2607531 RepID=A0A7E6EM00_9MOLL|nr:putative leucine-rich repeat-containing protein DDB_G0290503 [Octopus sinensis]